MSGSCKRRRKQLWKKNIRQETWEGLTRQYKVKVQKVFQKLVDWLGIKHAMLGKRMHWLTRGSKLQKIKMKKTNTVTN